MSNEDVIGCVSIFVLAFLALVLILAGYSVGKDSINQELLKRGLKHYEAKTGALVWTEEKPSGE